MNYPAFILCCLVAMLALAGCDETTRPSSPAPTAVVEILPTTTPYSEPAPTAAPEVSLPHCLLPRSLLRRQPDGAD